MDSQSVASDSVASSQASVPIFELGLPDKENLSPVRSSPLKSDCALNLKEKRLPTVTPKRFSRFFTPRNSSRTRSDRQVSRQLQEIKAQVNHSPKCELGSGEPPAKRRRRITTTPQSSPIKASHTPAKVFHIYDDSDDEIELEAQPPRLIRRLVHQTDPQRLLQRSFGLQDSIRPADVARPYASTTSYCSSPQDVFDFRTSGTSLPFCTTPCNTNSLVAFGDEDGVVRMLDTARGAGFAKPHVSMKVHRNAVMDMAFSTCDYLLATSCGDQTIRVVDVQTQRVMSVMAGHRSSVKQVKFHPGNDKMLTSSARDGIINIWDLRCSSNAVQTMRLGYAPNPNLAPGTLYPYSIMLAGPAHRLSSAKQKLDKYVDTTASVSITAIQHLPGSRSHLLLSASEQNSSLKLFDLRVAGRNTKSDKYGFEIPVAATPSLSSHKRHFGISALVLSSDGARAYSVCRDSTIWAYSTQHLILGSAPEMVNTSRRTRPVPPDRTKEGLGPLYGLRHPKLRVSSFYIRASIRKPQADQEELLALGSQESCPILFPLDERHFRTRDGDDNSNKPSRLLFSQAEQIDPPIHNVGTALVGGHRKEVTALTFAHGGELTSVSDDFTARCWREDAVEARRLRGTKDNVWRHAWAEAPTRYDDDEDDE